MKLGSVKAVYGHWPHCKPYHEFVKKHGKESRLPFRWVGYTKRAPKGWVNKQSSQKKKEVGMAAPKPSKV
jgi:hypothetical protein